MRTYLSVVALALLVSATIFSAKRTEHVSAVPASRIAVIELAASNFLAALTSEQRQRALLAPEGAEHVERSNVPSTSHPGRGIALGELGPEQRILAHNLLQSVLSSQGYLKTTGIIHLEDMLMAISAVKRADSTRVPGSNPYWLSFRGEPGNRGGWGWQLNGPHLALNITITQNGVSVTPAFMGTGPHPEDAGDYAGWRILGKEDDKGLLLFQSLGPDQFEAAQLAPVATQDIFIGPGRADSLQTLSGLKATALLPEQKGYLTTLLQEYVHNLEHHMAHYHMQKIEDAGFDDIHIAWMGPRLPGPADSYYYRIHGPTFLIEFDSTPPAEPGNLKAHHIHSIFRDLENDLGDDLLKNHYLENH